MPKIGLFEYLRNVSGMAIILSVSMLYTCVPHTGATGFVGSVALEQILRLCPGVSKLYLLIRPKLGSSAKTLTGHTSCPCVMLILPKSIITSTVQQSCPVPALEPIAPA